MERYFWLRVPQKRSTVKFNRKTNKNEKQSIYETNIEKRERFIAQCGEKTFYEKIAVKGSLWEKYKDIPVPRCFRWLFDKFLDIWYNSGYDFNGNVIFTYESVNEYETCMKVHFTIYEKRLLFQMKYWAMAIIKSFEKEK